jgi:hypothetical protein
MLDQVIDESSEVHLARITPNPTFRLSHGPAAFRTKPCATDFALPPNVGSTLTLLVEMLSIRALQGW